MLLILGWEWVLNLGDLGFGIWEIGDSENQPGARRNNAREIPENY